MDADFSMKSARSLVAEFTNGWIHNNFQWILQLIQTLNMKPNK